MKAQVEDPNALVGQFIRHVDNLRIYRIESVEERGAVTVEVEGMHLPKLPTVEPELFTWRLIQAKYNILVQAEDIGGLT